MMRYLPNSVLTAAWVVVLIGILWTVWGTLSILALIGIAIVGSALPIVITALARPPAQTTAEAISAAKSSRSA